jgi:hypothetical protein
VSQFSFYGPPGRKRRRGRAYRTSRRQAAKAGLKPGAYMCVGAATQARIVKRVVHQVGKTWARAADRAWAIWADSDGVRMKGGAKRRWSPRVPSKQPWVG